MFQTYRWVAMLDPVELADGDALVASGRRSAALSPLTLEHAVREVQHGGRPAWEAVARTTGHYQPRCTCCPALDGVHSHQRHHAERGLPPQTDVATHDRSRAHRVRLDLATVVLVLSEEQGGGAHGRGWHATLESVDQDVPRVTTPLRRGRRSPEGHKDLAEPGRAWGRSSLTPVCGGGGCGAG